MEFLIPILNTVAIAIVFLITMAALVSAPWQVLLLILVVGVMGCQWLIRRNHLQGLLEDINQTDQPERITAAFDEADSPQSASQSAQEPVLSYRGAHYTHLDVAESANVESSGKYRGSLWKSSSQSGKEMTSGKYRGGVWKSSHL